MISQARRVFERRQQTVKGRGGSRNVFGITAERKVGRDRRLDKIGKVFEKQGRGMPGLIFGRGITSQRLPSPETWSLRHGPASRQGSRQRGSFALQIRHDGIDVIEKCIPIRHHPLRFRIERLFFRFEFLKDLAQTLPAEQPENHFDPQIGLCTVDPLRVKKSRQVGGRRVRGVELRQRWDQQ